MIGPTRNAKDDSALLRLRFDKLAEAIQKLNEQYDVQLCGRRRQLRRWSSVPGFKAVRELVSMVLSRQPPHRTPNPALGRVVFAKGRKAPSLECVQNARVVRKLGSGHSGTVYAARRGDKTIAVKLSRLGFEQREPGPQLRATEAGRLAGKLGIGPKVYDVYVCRAGQDAFLVTEMELVPGVPWPAWYKRASRRDRERALALVNAHLKKLHDRGITHNDLTNSNNIMVHADSSGVRRVTLVDFDGFGNVAHRPLTAAKHAAAEKEQVNKFLTDVAQDLEERAECIAALLLSSSAVSLR
jgi:predicted Ser/Thr protein kinase